MVHPVTSHHKTCNQQQQSKPYYQPAGKKIDYKSAGKIEARNHRGKEDYQPAGKKIT